MKKKLLLLEDDLALNETVVDYFESLGFSVTPVYDGNSGPESAGVAALVQLTRSFFVFFFRTELLRRYRLFRKDDCAHTWTCTTKQKTRIVVRYFKTFSDVAS